MSDKLNFGIRPDISGLASESFFRSMEEMSSGTLATDAHGTVVWIDQKYMDIIGVSAEDVIGKPILEVLPNSRILEVLASGEPIPLDLMKYTRGWCIVCRFPILDETRQIRGAFGIILDGPAMLSSLAQRFDEMRSRPDSSIGNRPRTASFKISDFVGSSANAMRVREAAIRASKSKSTVLISGPSGTGKEIVAQGIHNASSRSRGPFVAINVSAIPETLVEAELFGSVAGAYTGADRKNRLGKIQLADKGTLFLDEIGDMPPGVQAKLLRFLEERSFEPLGSNRLTSVDVRVIAATSLDLRGLLASARFRTDLYYRLNVLPIKIEPLKARREDVGEIARSLLDAESRSLNAPQETRCLAPEAIEFLMDRPWSGNVRELRNVIQRAILECEGSEISRWLVAKVTEDEAVGQESDSSTEGQSLAAVVENVEHLQIAQALRRYRNNLTSAARSLSISRTTLYKKALAHGLLTDERLKDRDPH